VKTERGDEAIARKLVQHVLGGGVSADWYDDGSRDGMVDAQVTYPDGTVAALEVVGNHDPNYRSLDDAIRKGGARIDAPTLRNTWILNLKEHADVRTIRKAIVALIESLEAASLPGNLKWPDGRLWMTDPKIAEEFTRLGVQFANSVPSLEPRVYLLTPFLGGCAADPNQLVGWVEQFLEGTPDVPAKLAASGHEERHAFIWTTETTDYAATSVLEVDEELPTVAPRLPGGITHLWICSDHARHRVVMWEAGSGWRDVYRMPDDGVIPFA